MISRCNPVLACEMSLRPNDRHVTLRADGSQRFRQKKWQIHPQKMCALHGTRDDHGALFGCFCGRVRDEDDAAAEVNEAFHLMHEGKTLRSVITFPHAGVAEVAAHRAEHLRGAIAFLHGLGDKPPSWEEFVQWLAGKVNAKAIKTVLPRCPHPGHHQARRRAHDGLVRRVRALAADDEAARRHERPRGLGGGRP
jgi:hypothetical protein